MSFGLEALSETVERHKEGRYETKSSLIFSKKSTDLKTSNRSRAITQEVFGSKIRASIESCDSISKVSKIRERLKQSKMESARKGDDQFDGISMT